VTQAVQHMNLETDSKLDHDIALDTHIAVHRESTHQLFCTEQGTQESLG